MAPKKSITKKKSHAGKKAPRKAGSALYSLFLQKRGGAEAHFWIFDGLDAVVAGLLEVQPGAASRRALRALGLIPVLEVLAADDVVLPPLRT